MKHVLLCLALLLGPGQILAQDIVTEADSSPTLAVEDVPDDTDIAKRLRSEVMRNRSEACLNWGGFALGYWHC